VSKLYELQPLFVKLITFQQCCCLLWNDIPSPLDVACGFIQRTQIVVL